MRPPPAKYGSQRVRNTLNEIFSSTHPRLACRAKTGISPAAATFASVARSTFHTPLPPLPRYCLRTRTSPAASRFASSRRISSMVGYECVSDPHPIARVVYNTSLVPSLRITSGCALTKMPAAATSRSSVSRTDRSRPSSIGFTHTSTPSICMSCRRTSSQ